MPYSNLFSCSYGYKGNGYKEKDYISGTSGYTIKLLLLQLLVRQDLEEILTSRPG